MIKLPFENGGFVLHKVHLPVGTGRYSAWYNRAGELQDAERIDGAGKSRTVRRGGGAWRQLQAQGARWGQK